MELKSIMDLLLQMAWKYQGEETQKVIKDYVCGLTPEQKIDLQQTYDRSITPRNEEWGDFVRCYLCNFEKSRSKFSQNLGVSSVC